MGEGGNKTCNNHQTVSQCEAGRHVNASWSERAVGSIVKHLRQTSASSSVAVDHVFTDYFRFPGNTHVESLHITHTRHTDNTHTSLAGDTSAIVIYLSIYAIASQVRICVNIIQRSSMVCFQRCVVLVSSHHPPR